MHRRTFTTLLAGAAGLILTGAASAAPPTASAAPAAASDGAGVKNVVLVHGAYADGSCWSEVIVRLQAAGLRATAVQHPLTALAAGVEATRRALALQDGPTLLVGHSFAGMIVSEVGVDSKVTGLVYVAARAPEAGEDYTALAKRFPAPPASAGLVWSNGYGKLSEQAFLRDFAGDVSRDKARVLYAVQAPISDQLFAGRTTQAAWRTKPSWYAVSSEDRTINPELQRFMARRMNAMTVELKASHLSLISQPDGIARLIVEAAAGH